MKSAIITTLIIVFFNMNITGQIQMEEGFEMLETGSFANAEMFFEEIIGQHPDNKTAQICFARAVGLNGNPSKAFGILSQLEKVFPNDTEIRLNLAEAFMWQSHFKQAGEVYSQIIESDSSNFTALLGFANANASLNQYDRAFHFINSALKIQDGHQSALTSKKFILLGLANQAKTNFDYRKGHIHLDEVMTIFPLDSDALILRADLFLSAEEYSSARKTYQELILDPNYSYQGFKGLAYSNMVLGHYAQSLSDAELAIQNARTSIEKSEAILLKANTLGVMKKYGAALELITSIGIDSTNEIQINAAIARIKGWSKQFVQAIDIYGKVLAIDSTRIEALMGMVDIYRAQGKDDLAIQQLETVLDIYPMQPDAHRLLQSLKNGRNATIQSGVFMMKDNGLNQTKGWSLTIQPGKVLKSKPTIYFEQKNLTGAQSEQELKVTTASVSNTFNLNSTTKMQVNAGFVKYKEQEAMTSNNVRGGFGLTKEIGSLQQVQLAVSRELYDYNTSLIRQNLAQSLFKVGYHFTPPAKLGLYTQYIHTFQSDDNDRMLLFSSLYFKLTSSVPTIKLGVNGNVIRYRESKPELYFSPKNAKSAELFLEIIKPAVFGSKSYLSGVIATGLQKIDSQPIQKTFRIQVEGGYQITQSLALSFYYMSGNTVQQAVDGYAFSKAGFQVKYTIGAK